MDILVIGGGGREHAIVWKLNNRGHNIFCAPGNPGIADIAECVSLQVNQMKELADFAQSNKIDLTVVGPEDPLTNGIVDQFEKRSLLIFGPNQESAHLEGSKAYAKKVMERFNVPTAAYMEFDDFEEALAYVEEQGFPIVIKADGLAAGKGVTVAETIEEAETALQAAMLQKIFGESGTKVVIEECLLGEEMTVLAFVDGVPIGTGRILDDGHIGRVAVLKKHRGLGIGKLIMRELVKWAEDMSLEKVWLSSQWHAHSFYLDLGFVCDGEIYKEAGIDHIKMYRAL